MAAATAGAAAAVGGGVASSASGCGNGDGGLGPATDYRPGYQATGMQSIHAITIVRRGGVGAIILALLFSFWVRSFWLFCFPFACRLRPKR